MIQFETVAARPCCPVCGAPIGRRADNKKVTTPHDRQDQAYLVGTSNPCPGAGQPTV